MQESIELRGLTKSFGPVRAVDGVSLTIPSGEIVALLGPNGAGKSTTIDMLLGLARPDAGDVSLFGLAPAEAIARGAVGAMLQTGGLIRELTVQELLAMVGSLYPNPLPVDEVIARTGIDDVARRRTNTLSGGQTQRVRFALALIPDPDLLVLDEPTVAMDVGARQGFWDSMRDLGTGARGGTTGRRRTVVFATHYLEEADLYADRIVLMAGGRIVADGAATEIKAMVGTRTIRGTLPGASQPGQVDRLRGLPGVAGADVHGESVTLTCTDADVALRAVLAEYAGFRDVEVRGAGLEEAFLELTSDRAKELA